MEIYNLDLYDKTIVPGKCPMCNNDTLERIQHGQWGCKQCRVLYLLSKISKEEMIEWFVN